VTPPENKPPNLPRWERTKAILQHPVLLVITALASIVGIVSAPLAIYFYLASQRDPRLTYLVHPVRVPIVQGQKLTSLKVLFNGADVQGDIIAAQIAIWNAGAGSIRSTDIMAAIQIQTEGNSPILEATIRKMTRPVIGVTINQTQSSAGRVHLDWKILEKNDGFVLQVIYSGSINTKLSLTGDVAGQKSFVGYFGSAPTPAEQYAATNAQIRVGAWLGIFLGTFFLVTVMLPPPRKWHKKMVFEQLRKITATLDEQTQKSLPQVADEIKFEEDKALFWWRLIMVVPSLLLIGLSIGLLYSLSAPLPPFDF
jgi:hypothetical protein